MALKSPVENIPWNKKSLEIKSYHFETLFSRTPVWFYAKKSPEKALSVENAWDWDQRMFITIEIRDLTLKTPLAILNIQMHRKKGLFMKTSKNWPYFPKTFSLFYFQFQKKGTFPPKYLFSRFFFLWLSYIDLVKILC